jgi:hypothetical protein
MSGAIAYLPCKHCEVENQVEMEGFATAWCHDCGRWLDSGKPRIGTRLLRLSILFRRDAVMIGMCSVVAMLAAFSTGSVHAMIVSAFEDHRLRILVYPALAAGFAIGYCIYWAALAFGPIYSARRWAIVVIGLLAGYIAFRTGDAAVGVGGIILGTTGKLDVSEQIGPGWAVFLTFIELISFCVPAAGIGWDRST